MHRIEREDDGIAVSVDFSTPDRALSIERDGQQVVAPSPVGISTPDGEFPEDYEFVGRDSSTVTETVRTSRGKRRVHDHRAESAEFAFESSDGRTLVFEVRVADDGVGYRYRVGGDGRLSLFGSRPGLGADDSGFRVPAESLGWLFEYGVDHESVGRHYSAHRVDGEFSMPGLFYTGECWVLIAEAGVDGTYAASRLSSDEASTLFEYRMPRTMVHARLPTSTPWRVAIVGDIETIGSSSLVPQLVGDARVDPGADWVEPGRVAWSWWSDSSSTADAQVQREYIDYASERGWEYVLIDADWDATDVPGLVDYADERDVGIFLWAHWTDLHRSDERERRLDRWDDWGVAGIKVDFMDSDDQGRHQFYDEIAESTAERELLVNFHGSVVPTGLSSRWPHVLSYEGVMGAEHYHAKALPPEHNVVLAFTRNVVGPMDYTPVALSTDNRVTSDSHELALSVVFESGLQHFADSPETYAGRPNAEWFLERVPAAWDETTVLSGWPGSCASIARRRGDEYFVGTICAGEARTLDVSLPFLDESRDGTLLRDGENGNSIVREQITVGPGADLTVSVARHGGFSVHLPGE
jgi:hypothetical protein